jgi:hypothetical protein
MQSSDWQKTELTLVDFEKRDKFYSAVPKNDLLANLSRCMDRPSSVAVLGQTPGSRAFVGEVKGDTFWIRKKDASLKPFARTLHGKVVTSAVGTQIEYNFKNNGLVTFVQVIFVTIVCGLNAIVALVLFLDGFKSAHGADWLFLVVPPLLLLLILGIRKISVNLSFATDEEILDHVKMIAAGAHPSG